METAIAGSTLPCATLCNVVCTLVATGIAGTNSTATPTPVQQLEPLPEGYVAYSDIGVAYKVYDEMVSWREAKKRCIREKARLALIDSTRKLEHLKSQKKSDTHAHVGIIRMDNSTWVDDTTGDELGALPWLSGYPNNNNYDCVRVQFLTPGLWNGVCKTPHNYVCEIPIIAFRNKDESGP